MNALQQRIKVLEAALNENRARIPSVEATELQEEAEEEEEEPDGLTNTMLHLHVSGRISLANLR